MRSEIHLATFNINVDIIIGKSSGPVLNSWLPVLSTNDIEIDRYGSIWGESEVLNLGAHFDIYSSNSFGTMGNTIGTTTTYAPPPNITISTLKSPGSSISGNFGEVLTILALENKVAPNPLRVCHLTSTIRGIGAIKCPDLLLESTPFVDDYLTFRSRNLGAPLSLPEIIPGECKNNDYLKALRQLAQYWAEITVASPAYGFGLISSIDYRSNPPSIKFNLLIPEDINRLENLLTTTPVEELRQRDFRGCLYGF